jgi:hypothetical protein
LTQDSVVRFKRLFWIVGAIMTPFVRKSCMKKLGDSFAKLKSLAETENEEPKDT